MAVRRGIGFAVAFVFLLALGVLLESPPLLILAAMAAGLALVFASGGGWRPWLVLATLALLAAGVAYGQLDGLLAHMHRFGHASYSLSSIGARGGEPKVAFDAVRGWAEWTSEPGVTDLYASPRHVVDLALAMDAMIIVSLASILLLLLFKVRRAVRRLSQSAQGGLFESAPTPEAKADRRLLVGGMCMVGLAVAADLLEDLGYWGAVHHYWSASSESSGPGWMHLLVAANWWLTLAKFGAYGLAVLALVVGATGLRRSPIHRDRAVGVWRTAKILRGQIAITLVLGGVFVLHPQAADVIRRWNTRQGLIAYVLAIVLVLIGWAFGKRLMTVPARHRLRPRASILALIGGGLLGVVLFLWLIHAPAWGLAIPGVFWLVVAGSDALFGHPDLSPEPPLVHGRRAMPRLVAVGAIGVLGLAVLRAAVGGYVLLGGRSTEGPLVLWGAGMLLSAWGLYLILRIGKLNDPPAVRHAWFADPFVWVMGFALLVGIYVWVRIGQNVWATSVQLGAVGVIEVFLILATIVVGGLVMLAEWVASPKTFQLLGFRRFPVFILLLGWAVIASTLPVSVGYHDVRFLTVPATDTRTMSLPTAETPQSVFRRWLEHLPAGSFDAAVDGSRRGVPLILISTAGGGVKAGYWTALVLDCLLQAHPIAPACAHGASGRDQTARVLAASGASGGSMGLMTYVAHATQSPSDPTDGANWVAARLGGDYLSAELAWELAVELPRSLLRFSPGMDRAEVSERAWQASWVRGPWTPSWTHASWSDSASEDAGPMAQGFFDLWERGGQAGGPAVPLLMLNGTGVTTGCRFNTSALDGNGGDHGLPPGQAPIAPCLANDPLPDQPPPQPVLAATQDLEDFLCQVGDQRRIDVRLSTAVMLSARFPFVSPSGRIEYCGAPRQAAFVVDGGYQDNSGASSILELWRSLEPLVADYNAGRAIGAGDPANSCLVPFLIQIDSGYGEPTPDAPTKRPGELTVPVTGALSARSAFTALVEQAARIAFNRADPLIDVHQDNRYARLYPRAHPGTEAPTGWVLSNASQRDLLAQLAENGDQIKEVQSWFSSALTCG